MTLRAISQINRERSRLWHVNGTEPWSGADWSNAMQGEAGEAGNVVKKLRRQETGLRGARDPDTNTLRKMLADEIGDTFLYLDLLAEHYDIDMYEAIRDKFNAVSVREGFDHWLTLTEPS